MKRLLSALLCSTLLLVFGRSGVCAQTIESYDPTKLYVSHSQASTNLESSTVTISPEHETTSTERSLSNITSVIQREAATALQRSTHLFSSQPDQEMEIEAKFLPKKNPDTVISPVEHIPITLPEFFPSTSSTGSADGCDGVHNPQKSYSVASAAKLLAMMLKKGPNGLLSQFRCQDAHNPYIPLAAQQIYELSPTWRPFTPFFSTKASNAYVQCPAFIFMSYQMAGKPILKKGRTNAADFLAQKYSGNDGQFLKFKNSQTSELPREGDIVVWSPEVTHTSTGHVGIVVEVREESNTPLRSGTIRVANANSNRAVHEYRFEIDERDRVTLKKVAKDWAKVPDYWLRMK